MIINTIASTYIMTYSDHCQIIKMLFNFERKAVKDKNKIAFDLFLTILQPYSLYRDYIFTLFNFMEKRMN